MGEGKITENSGRIGGMSTGTIKIVACISMLIDHFAASLLSQRLFHTGKLSLLNIWPDLSPEMMKEIIMVLRQVGRPAFLIYAFFLTFGFTKTKNKFMYLLRLMALAVISEVPFDMMLYGKIFNNNYQNVFFTLSIGLGTIWLMDICIKDIEKLKTDLIYIVNNRNIDKSLMLEGSPTKTVNAIRFLIFKDIVFILMILFVGIGLANNLKTDYRYMGVTVIVIIYLFNLGYKYASYGIMLISPIINFASVVTWYLWKVVLISLGPDADYVPNAQQINSTLRIVLKNNLVLLGFCALVLLFFIAIRLITKDHLAVSSVKKGRLPEAQVYFYSSLLGALFLFAINHAEACAFVGSFFILAFNGKKGWNNKWFFYLFYPVHLLIFGLVMFFSR